MNKTAIVIGATGLVGSNVVEVLVNSQDISKVVTITRRPQPHSSEKVENHVIDFERLSEAASLFMGDMLFSCLGTTAKTAGSIKAQRRVDLDYQYIAAQLAESQSVDHYLLVSSSGADSRSLSPYLRMKGELEDRVQDLKFNQISIFQPSLLLGDRGESRFAEEIASRVLPLLCKLPGLNRYRPIQGQEVAQKMVDIGLHSNPGIQRYKLDDVFPD